MMPYWEVLEGSVVFAVVEMGDISIGSDCIKLGYGNLDLEVD